MYTCVILYDRRSSPRLSAALETETHSLLSPSPKRKAGHGNERVRCQNGETVKRQDGERPKRTGQRS